ncbi:MAG: hypothetical protein GY832_00165 [Chloroflexi bacterium]|nr:hypothetical protein [Chloroflexota bacterium]
MDYGKVLKRAWETTWRYRALWIFGIIIALTTASGSSGSTGGGGNGHRDFQHSEYQWQFDEDSWPFEEYAWQFDEHSWSEIPPHVVNSLIGAGVAVACVVILLTVAATIARYVARTALIRMVDDQEKTGEQRSVREGFRMGWSRTTFRLFMIDLLICLPVAIVFISLFLLSAAPLLLWLTEQTPMGVIGTISSSGLFLIVVLLAIVVGAVITVLQQFFWRVCALKGLRVIESIREGLSIVRQNLKDVGVMWLIMIGVRIGWMIVVIVSLIVLFPVVLFLIVLGVALGGLPALLAGGLTSLFVQGPAPWIAGAVIGIPIFMLVVSAPWVFVSGLMEVFKSSTWTLTYRELQALKDVETEVEVEAETTGWSETEAEPGLA